MYDVLFAPGQTNEEMLEGAGLELAAGLLVLAGLLVMAGLAGSEEAGLALVPNVCTA